MTDDENVLDLDELRNQLKAHQEQFEILNESLKPIDSEKGALKAKVQEAYERYQKEVKAERERNMQLDEVAREIRSKRADEDRIVHRLKDQIEREEERRRKAERDKRRKEALQVEGERWDFLTAGAPWREWAKQHQIDGGKTLTSRRKIILADPMGLGKTLTYIASADMVKEATKDTSPEFPFLGEEKLVNDWSDGTLKKVPKIVDSVERPSGRKILYFCPASLMGNVEREFRRWSPNRSVMRIGGMSKAERAFALGLLQNSGHDEFVVICNYEAWRRDKGLIESLIDVSFDTVVIDEAHNIKDRSTSAYKGISEIIEESQPEYVIPMTGTPVLNRPQELFSLLTLVAPKTFHSELYFLQDYCQQNMDGKWVWKPGGMDRLMVKLRPYIIRRTKDQAGIELPPKTITIHEIEIDTDAYPNQARARDQMRKYAMIMLDPEQGKAITAPIKMVVYQRLRQVETWPAGIHIDIKEMDSEGDWFVKETLRVDIEESQKLDYVIRWDAEQREYTGLLPEFIGDERGVIFSQFIAPLEELKERIERAGYRAAVMTGATPNHVRDEIMRDFDITETPNREDAKYDVVLCHYKVGGVGMNLTGATQMIIVDEEWNPGKRDQAYDRIHRMGQEKPVTIHVLRDTPSIDLWLANLIAQKEEVVGELETAVEIGDNEIWTALNEGLI